MAPVYGSVNQESLEDGIFLAQVSRELPRCPGGVLRRRHRRFEDLLSNHASSLAAHIPPTD